MDSIHNRSDCNLGTDSLVEGEADDLIWKDSRMGNRNFHLLYCAQISEHVSFDLQ